MADSGGSQFFPKAAREKNGGAAMGSYAGNLVERQLSNFLTGGTHHGADLKRFLMKGVRMLHGR